MITINYNELIKKLDNKDTFVLYIGGEWCKNCRPVSPFIKELSNKTFFNYDSRDNKEAIDDIRKCNNEEQTKQYKNLIKKLNYNSIDKVVIDEVETNIPLIKVPSIFAIKEGKVVDILTKEYLEEDLNEFIINEYKVDLNKLKSKITHH